MVFSLAIATQAFQFLHAQDEKPQCDCPDFYNYQHDNLEAALADVNPVTSLDLGMQKLTTIDPRIGKFTELLCLDLSFNRFAKLPPEFANLKKLQCLKLTGTNYMATMPDILKQLPALKFVDVSDHQLWSAETKKKAKEMLPGVTVVTD